LPKNKNKKRQAKYVGPIYIYIYWRVAEAPPKRKTNEGWGFKKNRK
jgi:hypothetical protein